MADCAWQGCPKPARARGFCDTHYRHVVRRERGVGGIEPHDSKVYKIRVRTANGTQPYYYSKIEAAMTAVARYRREGTLLYFAEYVFSKRL